jgi:hypothetical protein
MPYEQKQYQTYGAQNQSFQGGTFFPYSNAESFLEVQPCVTAPLPFHPAREDRQPPVESTDHSIKYSNAHYQYQPITWNGDYDRAAAELAAFNLNEVSLKSYKFLPMIINNKFTKVEYYHT